MSLQPFTPPTRLLMGPGPSDAPPSVLSAMSQTLVGHLDPSFVQMMEEIKEMLRKVFLTENEMTFPISGTGSAGMEFCFVNLIEPGDEVIVGVNGVFGGRMAEVAARCGANVTKFRRIGDESSNLHRSPRRWTRLVILNSSPSYTPKHHRCTHSRRGNFQADP